MAQSDNGRSTPTIDVPKPQNSPGSKSSRTHGGSSSWSSISSLKLRRNSNHDNDDSGNHPKRSVFSKVKEKARKLKKSLSGKKHGDSNELRSPNFTTPPGSAGPVKDDKQRPQFFSSPTPLQGSPGSADTKKDSPKDGAQETKKESSETSSPPKKDPPPKTEGSSETTATRDASDPKTSSEAEENIESNTQPQDKGVSVKEYLMNKLEPGEDERALSQAITQTISPKCEKMKEAVSSLLGNEETVSVSNSEADTTPADSDSNQDVGARSSTESVDTKLTSLNVTSLNLHDPSDGPEARGSNVSDISRGSETMPASCQIKNLEQSS